MANLTITVDDQVLHRALVRALGRHESVNAYLAAVLSRYADAGTTARAVFHDLGRLADAEGTGADGSGRAWRRDELHRA